MRIIIFIDKNGTAIYRLAQLVKKYNPHLKIEILPVHPKENSPEVFAQAGKLIDWADIIDIHYWKSGEVIKSVMPKKFFSKPRILFHFNPYDADNKEINEQYQTVVVGNTEIQSKVPSSYLIPYGTDLDFFKFNEEYTNDQIVNMSVSRIEGKKGVREVAQACKELGYKFRLVGRVSKPDYMMQVMEAGKGSIEFLENASDEQLRDVYYQSSIHVCNSVDNFESGCYDDKTEILTDEGWKLFKDLDKNELVATLNPKTDYLEYQKPLKYIVQDNHKELIVYDNNSVSMYITKNHNVWAGRSTTRRRKHIVLPFQFYRADKLPGCFEIKKTCKWEGNTAKDLDWFRFMAIYLSEGSIEKGSKNSYRIQLAVTKKEVKNKVRDLLNRLQFSYTEYFDRFRIGKQNRLGQYLIKFGKAPNKFIPREILNAPEKYIQEFLDWFIYGDGSIHKNNGARTYYSCSKKLIDGLQECLIKVGKNGSIKVIDNRGKKRIILGKKPVNTNYRSYVLYERCKCRNVTLYKTRHRQSRQYHGRVYCVEVKNHILLVRRNGIPYFCGNTLPILESMATGVPVLTRNIGIVPDLYNGGNMVVRNGRSEDIEDLKSNLKLMMENRGWRLKIREKAWETIKNWDARRMIIRVAKLYQGLYKPERCFMSVIIPTKDNPEAFVQGLVGVLKQDYEKMEVVVVDSGDTPVRPIIEEARKKTEIPIKYIYFPNRGEYTLAEARNRGVVEADGDYLIFCDDRLQMEKGAVEVFAQHARPKSWFWGIKDGVAKAFVENFSCVNRRDLISGGMFCERMEWYGGMTQEIRNRFEVGRGFDFTILYEAKAKGVAKSKSKKLKRQDIVEAKYLLFKMYEK